MTIIEFFTIDRIVFAGTSKSHASRILNLIHRNNRGLRIGVNFENAYTLDRLLSANTPFALLQTPGIGYRAAEILSRTLEDAGHRFTILQCVTKKDHRRYLRDHSKE